MPTPAERKALVFFAALALLGAGVRMARAPRSGGAPDAGARRALAAQLARVDSARAARAARGAGERRPRGRRAARDSVAGRPRRAKADTLVPTRGRPLDLDVATAAEIERLPGIGAVLAARIVAHRDTCGALGSIDGLDRVPGVGPRLAERLRSLVTFSGRGRPSFVGSARCREAAGGARSRPIGHVRHSAIRRPGAIIRSRPPVPATTGSTMRASRPETVRSRRGVTP